MSHALILGNIGTGKSTLAKTLLARHRKRIIIDPRGEHRGPHITSTVDNFLRVFQNGYDGRTGTIVLHFGRAAHGIFQDMQGAADALFSFLLDCRGFCIFIDEVDEFCSPTYIPESFKRLINYQRHFGVDLVLVARRAASIHRDLSALAHDIYMFQMHEPNDVAYARAAVGNEYSVRLHSLARFAHFHIQTLAPAGPSSAS